MTIKKIDTSKIAYVLRPDRCPFSSWNVDLEFDQPCQRKNEHEGKHWAFFLTDEKGKFTLDNKTDHENGISRDRVTDSPLIMWTSNTTGYTLITKNGEPVCYATRDGGDYWYDTPIESGTSQCNNLIGDYYCIADKDHEDKELHLHIKLVNSMIDVMGGK